jgi:hypothetical protein
VGKTDYISFDKHLKESKNVYLMKENSETKTILNQVVGKMR